MAEPRFRRPRVPDLQLAEAPRLGHTVIEARDVAFGWPGSELFSDVSLLVQSGDRVGIVGPNGAGKTTLLRVLLGELPPRRGTVLRGRSVQVAHHDQGRESLDPEETVYEAASAEEHVELGGTTVALRDYLDDLLFTVPMQRMKVGALSGGERNRLLLARLFLQGANVLVLDEPTNDLDLPTLNVLERLLLGFKGAVLLVTHDRYFLDKVATRIVAVEGDGKVVSWPGNFTTYRSLRAQAGIGAATQVERRDEPPAAASLEPSRPKRLGYQAQRELDGMEAAIEAAEARRSAAEADLLRPDVYSDGRRAAEAQAALAAASTEVERLYARWAELTSLG
jgi:ATP-binding cassette subfamily F protein uup